MVTASFIGKPEVEGGGGGLFDDGGTVLPGEREDAEDAADAGDAVVAVDVVADRADGRADALGGGEQGEGFGRSAGGPVRDRDAVPASRRAQVLAQELAGAGVEQADLGACAGRLPHGQAGGPVTRSAKPSARLDPAAAAAPDRPVTGSDRPFYGEASEWMSGRLHPGATRQRPVAWTPLARRVRSRAGVGNTVDFASTQLHWVVANACRLGPAGETGLRPGRGRRDGADDPRGRLVAVDPRRTELHDGELFAVGADGELLHRDLRRSGRRWLLTSGKPEHPTQPLTETDQVRGQAAWWATTANATEHAELIVPFDGARSVTPRTRATLGGN